MPVTINGTTGISTPGLTNSSGDMTITNGNLVLGTSGKGIDFSATSGTGTSELLADYEEGTFTPAFASTGGGAATSYLQQNGNYTKIGRVVYATIRLTLSNKTGLNAGGVTITGLPFTNAVQGRVGITSGYIANITSYGPGDFGQTFISGTTLELNDNAGTQVTVADLANNSGIDCQVTYYV